MSNSSDITHFEEEDGGSSVLLPLPNKYFIQILVCILGGEDPLEEGMATHFSILAWRIPWTDLPYGLQSIASQRVGHD